MLFALTNSNFNGSMQRDRWTENTSMVLANKKKIKIV